MPIPVHYRVLSRVLLAPSRIKPWHRWRPKLLGGLVLLGTRYRMRHENLYDTRDEPFREGKIRRARTAADRWRSADGSGNDLNDPSMGAAWGRFGRNVPLDRTRPDPLPQLLEPNPRLVSNRLLARREFIPATSLNMLAAAWIQFQVHGWFGHGDNDAENHWELEVAGDDDWPADERPMKIRRTRPDVTRKDEKRPPTFQTAVTHWWDGSQLYGSSLERQFEIRSHVDGKLRTTAVEGLPNHLLPVDETGRVGVDLTGFNDNYWLGLSLMHTLFAFEHNAICDRLKAEYPEWGDEELFQHARLVNSALMAKIHTIEWTPTLLDTPIMHMAMNANWNGILPSWLRQRVPWHLGEAISGIVGGKRVHDGVPYSLTEEFVTVYRMHPLIPDSYSFRRRADDSVLEEARLTEIQGRFTRATTERLPMLDMLYTFGTSHPGAIVLHNFPNELRNLRKFEAGAEVHLDLAAVDVLRDRERGVPRYNEFRELLGMGKLSSIEELTDDPELASELAEVYGNDINRVDTMVGMFAEKPPAGFAFSETAFRVFVLMASRRLSSDRFFTDDYRPEIYTQAGLDWIEQNTMKTVLERHFPELGELMDGLDSAFSPWKRAGAAAK